MKTTMLTNLRLLLGSTFLIGTLHAATAPKNVVLIICDDLGVGDVGCYFAKDNPTPHLDEMSGSGLVHQRFYTFSPSCSPSRAALLTGRDARTVGVNRVLMGTNEHALSKSATTLGTLFQDNGFNTGYIGKWHLGYGPDHDPMNFGFDYFFGHRGGKIDYFEYTDSAQKFKYDLWENKEVAKVDGYCTTEFARKSASFIDQNSQTPFFLYVSLNAPHWDNKGKVPAPREYMEKLGPDPDKREVYVGAMRAIDDCVKTITETLARHDLMKETVIIFTSDQGAWQATGGSNGPLRGFKGQTATFEGGMRIPFIMLWPGREKELGEMTKPGNLLDVFPTLAAGFGFDHDPKQSHGGDLFTGGERPIFGYHDHKMLVHYKGWKFVDLGKGRQQLYHLDKDPYEKTNLIKNHPEKAKEFSRLLEQYKESIK